MATYSSTLAWKSPWTEEPSGLQTMRSPRVGHDWAHTCTHTQSSTQGAGYWCFVLFIQLFNFLWWWEEGTGAVGSSKENILPPGIFPPASLTLLNLGNSPRSPWELSLHVQDIDYLQESRIQECYCICLQMRWLTAVLIKCLGRESGIRKFSSRCSWRPFICYQRKLLHMHVGEPTPSASFIKQGDHTLCCCPPKPGGLRPQFSSVAQSCLTLCDPVNCSTPHLPLKASERAIALKRKPLPLRRSAWILGSYLKNHFCPTPTSWTAWLSLTYRASSYFQPDCQSPCSQVITELWAVGPSLEAVGPGEQQTWQLYVEVKWKWKLLGCVWLFATLWTVACHTPLSMGFSRQEYWSG